MGVLVVIHVTGDPDRLADAYARHREGVWSSGAECQSHVMARSRQGLVIADEWVSEAGFRSRYADSELDVSLRQAGGQSQIHVAAIVDRSPLAALRREAEGAYIDQAALDERIVPRDS